MQISPRHESDAAPNSGFGPISVAWADDQGASLTAGGAHWSGRIALILRHVAHHQPMPVGLAQEE
jgi:hypothetical protein